MVRIDRPAIGCAPCEVSALLLPLDETIVHRLGDGLDVREVEEQLAIALMRHLVVRDRGVGLLSLAYAKLSGPLADVLVAPECLEAERLPLC